MYFEVKIFASNNNQLVAGKSNMYWEVSTRLSPIGDWSKDSIISWYFGIVQGSGKIPYTCNHLIFY